MKFRLNSKEERSVILVSLTNKLMDSGCSDIETLTEVDKLCRRTWPDLHPGWIRWAFYIEKLIGIEEYKSWARNNCQPLNK